MGFYYSQQQSHYPSLTDEKLSNLPKAVQGNDSPNSDLVYPLVGLNRTDGECQFGPKTSSKTGGDLATYLPFPFFPASLPCFSFCSWVTKVSFIPSVICCHPQKGHMSVAVTSLRWPCSKKSGDPRQTESVLLAGSGWARAACQEQQGGKSLCRKVCHPAPRGKPLPHKAPQYY